MNIVVCIKQVLLDKGRYLRPAFPRHMDFSQYRKINLTPIVYRIAGQATT